MEKTKSTKGKIQFRWAKADFCHCNLSTFDCHIVASGHIISEINKAVEKIIDKYPKSWED